MPVIRDPSGTPNADQAWSKLQHAVDQEIPRSIKRTAQAIRKIRTMRRSRV